MRSQRPLLLPLFCVVLCCAASEAQGPQFKAESRIVLVPVTVIDAQDHLISGISSEDFELLDNGVRQKITVDTADSGVAPISLVVAIQAAGISKPVLAKVRKIGSIFQPVITGERGEIAVLTFSGDVVWAQEFTADDDKIQMAFRNLKESGDIAGRMLDAVAEASSKMTDLPGRKVVLLISESKDRGSKTKLDDALNLIGRQGVQVFAATYNSYLTPFTAKPADVEPATAGPNLIAAIGELARNGKTDTVKALTRVSGGAVVGFATQKSLEAIIQKIGQELQSQYLLSFTPAHMTDGKHQITIRLRNSNANLRYRQSY